MSNDTWRDLILRLKQDLHSRQTGELRNGDDAAWAIAASLVRRHARIVPYTHTELTEEDADDIVQEILIKLHTSETLARLEISGSPSGYVTVMVRNAATSLIRKRRHSSALEDPLDEEFLLDIRESPIQDEERATRLREALTHLSIEERNLLRMRYWKGLSVRQVAERTGLSYSATAVRLFRILKRLRAKLGTHI